MARREQRGGRRGAARHGGGQSTIGRAPSLRKPERREKKPKQATLPTVRAHTKLPEVVAGPPGLPRAGEWLFTTRPGAEQDLIEELVYADPKAQPHPVGPSLVAARQRKGEQAFARQAFRVHTVVENPLLSRAVGEALAATGAPQPWAFDLWVPDSDEGNPLAQRAAQLAATVTVPPAWQQRRVADARAALAENGLYAQACLLPPGDRVAVGVIPARDAPSLAPGGRLRVHVPEIAPSRAAMKLEEAFLWLDRAPDPGDVCVDLGAAPGGWTWVLLERRARGTPDRRR
ncbi:MAG: SAM-dependent methyltransferase [Polyangia bacterium]